MSLVLIVSASTALHSLAVDLTRHRTVHVLQADADDDYSSRLWGCSVGMSRWMLADEATDLSGMRTVEIGAGTGLVSLSLAAAGAQALATDISSPALELIERAARQQGLPVTTARFDVRGDAPLPPCDLLVASDVLYTPPLADALAQRCVEALARGAYVAIGDPGRPEARESFLEALEEQNKRLPRVRCEWAAGCRDWLDGAGGGAADGRRRPASERLLLLHFESRRDPFSCATHQAMDEFE